MSSIFTRIIRGEIPCYKVAETEDCLAFLDINPNRLGHTLCVPKIEIDHWTELPDSKYQALMMFSKKVARAIGEVVHCKRVGMSVIGLDVPHVHVHLIPLDKMSDMTFVDKQKVDEDQMKSLCEKLYNKCKSINDK